VTDIWLLSLDAGMSGAICSFAVVEYMCKSKDLDVMEVYKTCKSMTNELNKK
jgi:hypothetical protein